VNRLSVTAIALEDQTRLHTGTMQCSLQAIASARKITSGVDWASYGWRKQTGTNHWGTVASLDWRNCRCAVAERQRMRERVGSKTKPQHGRYRACAQVTTSTLPSMFWL